MLAALATRPRWLVGVAADVLAVVLQATALRLGPVTLVQPLLVAGLPVAVLLSARLAGRRLRRGEIVGTVLCALGLVGLLPATTTAGLTRSPDRSAASLAAVVLIALVLALLVLARAWPAARAVATGAGAGATVGAGSVLLAVCAGQHRRRCHCIDK